MKLTLLLSLVAAFFVGCASPDGQHDSVKRKPATQIDTFRDGQKPTRAYKEIATLADDAREVEEPQIEAKMIQKAKRMGGNAIIFEPKSRSGAEFTGFFSTLSNTYLYKARVVVYE